MKLCVLMGSADISGGSYVIFEHCLHLAEAGVAVTVVTLDPLPDRPVPWHRALARLRFVSFEAVAEERFDLALATWWKTVYELHRIDAGRYAYFVQSIESWFYPDSDVAVRNLVNATYLLPLPGITEARWIRDHLRSRFGHAYNLVPNGCSKALYAPAGPCVAPREPGRLRILVEGPLGVDFKNVARTIALARRAGIGEIWLLTSSPVARYPGVARVFSRIPAADCAAVYRSCDVLLKLSMVEGMFGPPLEMFHCGGTAVVYDVTGHDEYIEHEANALVVATGDEAGVVAALHRLAQEPGLLARLTAGAARTAAEWPDWGATSPGFAAALQAIAAAPPAIDRDRLRLSTAEFFSQYVRAEQALQAARRRTPWIRAAHRAAGRLQGLARRSPGFFQRLLTWRARLLEERTLPRARTRI
ncbi:glycosyltransferase [Dankookia rubra]|uniref:Glycosyltransferase n=1 Tax=Dankookia rubra TaxID=1442381 RepID=A0A4R5QCZ4_9PROT|nr:glycosyltransferase [Dankookia rubra]TDH61042.1 glycosyltransferase [Dankookia rubra]